MDQIAHDKGSAVANIEIWFAYGRHAVLLADQAGWHTSHKLIVPPNISLLPLPPNCLEFNPIENVW